MHTKKTLKVITVYLFLQIHKCDILSLVVDESKVSTGCHQHFNNINVPEKDAFCKWLTDEYTCKIHFKNEFQLGQTRLRHSNSIRIPEYKHASGVLTCARAWRHALTLHRRRRVNRCDRCCLWCRPQSLWCERWASWHSRGSRSESSCVPASYRYSHACSTDMSLHAVYMQ